jgi:hypothetical protein
MWPFSLKRSVTKPRNGQPKRRLSFESLEHRRLLSVSDFSIALKGVPTGDWAKNKQLDVVAVVSGITPANSGHEEVIFSWTVGFGSPDHNATVPGTSAFSVSGSVRTYLDGYAPTANGTWTINATIYNTNTHLTEIYTSKTFTVADFTLTQSTNKTFGSDTFSGELVNIDGATVNVSGGAINPNFINVQGSGSLSNGTIASDIYVSNGFLDSLVANGFYGIHTAPSTTNQAHALSGWGVSIGPDSTLQTPGSNDFGGVKVGPGGLFDLENNSNSTQGLYGTGTTRGNTPSPAPIVPGAAIPGVHVLDTGVTSVVLTVAQADDYSTGTYDGVIEDGDSLTSLGLDVSGSQLLFGANTFTGGTVIEYGGLLGIGSDAAMGDTAGAVTINDGGTLQAENDVTADVGRPIAIPNAGAATFDVNSCILAIPGSISGSGEMIVTDSSHLGGTMVLSGSAAATTVTIAGGAALQITDAGSLPDGCNLNVGDGTAYGTTTAANPEALYNYTTKQAAGHAVFDDIADVLYPTLGGVNNGTSSQQLAVTGKYADTLAQAIANNGGSNSGLTQSQFNSALATVWAGAGKTVTSNANTWNSSTMGYANTYSNATIDQMNWQLEWYYTHDIS